MYFMNITVVVCTSPDQTNCLKRFKTLSTYDEAYSACDSLPNSTYLAMPSAPNEFAAVRNLSSISGAQCSNGVVTGKVCKQKFINALV